MKTELIKGIAKPTNHTEGAKASSTRTQKPSHVEKVKVLGSWAVHRIDYTDDDMLVVYMQDGSKLEYVGVPRRVFDEFQKAESKGKFFNVRIRNNYQFLG